jgi:hypothetical protein
MRHSPPLWSPGLSDWYLGAEGHIPALVKVPMLKCEVKLLPVLSEAQMASLRTYKPVGAA